MSLVSMRIASLQAPPDAKGMPYGLLFNTLALTSISDDLFAELSTAVLEFVQSLYIDNSLNPSSLTIQFQSTGQKISIRAGWQGFCAITEQLGNLRFIATTTGNVDVPIIFYNTWHATAFWPANENAVLNNAAFVSRSGSIAVGGTSQTLAAINVNRSGMMIYNPATAAGQGLGVTELLYYRIDGGAAGVDNGTSFELTPGGYAPFPASAIPTGLITVTATTNGHQYIAAESS